MYEYTKYSPDTYLLPVWQGTEVYNETVMFVDEQKVPLLYKVDQIISVRSSDLKTEYVQGEDYLLENGYLVRTPTSRIPMFTQSEYYPESPEQAACFPCADPAHPWIRYGEETTFFSRQVHVSYTHSDSWNGYIPPQSNKFSQVLQKLSQNEPINVVFFGDSITFGACSSKMIEAEPYADIWCEMVVYALKKHFHHDKIQYINTAVGGTGSDWGEQTIQQNAIAHNPDLLFLGFGGNDGWLPAETYQTRMQHMVDAVLTSCPQTEIAVVSTMLPHFRVAGFSCAQHEQERALRELCRQYSQVDLVPMTTMHQTLLHHKRYYDMTGNNVNHPNDFLARIYAQTAVKTLLG